MKFKSKYQGSDRIKKLHKLLPNKSKKRIKEKLVTLENQPKRKKAVIRNQKKPSKKANQTQKEKQQKK